MRYYDVTVLNDQEALLKFTVVSDLDKCFLTFYRESVENNNGFTVKTTNHTTVSIPSHFFHTCAFVITEVDEKGNALNTK